MKMLGLGIIFSYDIQRYVSNDQVCDSIWAIKIDKKCKYLLSFTHSKTEGTLIVTVSIKFTTHRPVLITVPLYWTVSTVVPVWYHL
jgi:hypothetical protein